MATHEFPLNYPVDWVWAALPHAVQQVRSAVPGRPVQGYRYTFSTRMSMLTYGQQVFVDLYPHQHGPTTHLRITTNMNFGIVDWGEGANIARELYAALGRVLAWWDSQQSPQGPPAPGPPGPPGQPGPPRQY